MSDRITDKQLRALVDKINRTTGRPEEPYRPGAKPGTTIAQIGCLHVSGAYGGVALHEIVNDAGGVRDLSGYRTKRELYTFLRGYMEALNDGPKWTPDA